MKKLISTSYLAVSTLLLVSLLFTSCNDTNLAKHLDGTWTTEDVYVEDSDEGISGNVSCMYMFQYNAKLKDKDGGLFVEWRHMDLDVEDEGMVISSSIIVKLEGSWEILLGDLIMEYDDSKLNVSVDNVDYHLSKNADYYTTMQFMQMYSDGLYLPPDMNGVTEAIRSQVYQNILEELQDEGAEHTFENVKIEGNTLTFDDEEGDTNTLTRFGSREE